MFRKRIRYSLFFLSVLILPGMQARPDVKLPAVIADHMVIQRGVPVHVWGMGEPGEVVTVSFRNESRSATADSLGRWSAHLPPVSAGGPFEMEVRGRNVIKISDILVGDIWLASGQSNMAFRMREVANAPAEIADAHRPRIRLFHVQKAASDYPLDDLSAAGWAVCSPESVVDFSAVAYFFARDVQKHQNVPIGVIEADYDGTPAEAWTSLRALSVDASLMPLFAARSAMIDTESTTLLLKEREMREIEQAKARGEAAPRFPWRPDQRTWAPSALYNAMIAPLTRFPLRGVIWYQGESNTDPARAPLYARVLQTLIQDWREAWAEGDFPFLFVQIANFETGPSAMWAEVRDAQRRSLTLMNTGMAVTIDIGEARNVHPTNKQEVGRRLALAARAIAYGEDLEYSGPLFRQAVQEGNSLRIWFDHVTSSLVAKGDMLKGFEVAGAQRQYVPADARIEGRTVIVSSPSVAVPVYVRYGWASNPECTLYNGDELPASPFTSER